MARLIPAISFETLSPHLRRLRFDVRCEPRLESLDESIEDAEFPVLGLMTRDAEVLDPLAPLSKGMGGAAFERIEKPLVYEICSTGWRPSGTRDDGSAAVAGEGTPLWDNVHIFPGKCDGEKWVPELPSAPGAYYALHCHWRWGAMLSDFWYLYNNSAWKELFSFLFPLKPKVGRDAYSWFMDTYFHTLHPDGRDAQYRGLPITADAGGPLFDPNLPVQTVQFLIAKTEHAKLPGVGAGAEFEFVRDFRAGRDAEPEFINGGETLSWWLSFAVDSSRPAEASESFLRPFGGTLFAHGMHFAHNLYEPTLPYGPDGSLSAPTRGRAAYVPDDVPRKWER